MSGKEDHFNTKGVNAETNEMNFGSRTESVQVEEPPQEDGVLTEIAALPEGAVITEQALARMLGKCRKTVKRMVERNELPPPVRMNGKPVWTAGAILKHIEERLQVAKRELQKERERISKYSP